MSLVLVVNSGSSSLKYSLLDPAEGRPLATGLIERIGQDSGEARHTVHSGTGAGPEPTVLETTRLREEAIPDHAHAFRVMQEAFAAYGPSLAAHPPVAVGHRVVHGGAEFVAPTLVTARVEEAIADLAVLAPLHNPANLAGIRAARAAFPELPHVAVFDTAFHQTLDPAAYTYAIDREVADRHRVRRYGFHGTSHEYVSRTAAAFLGRDLGGLRQIVFHLGNGASVTAVDGGRSVETSMGLTPLEGLVMGTRSGDVDPGVLLHLARSAGYAIDDLDDLLNRRSGLRGLSGHSDMRDVLAGVEAGEEEATLAYEVYVHRLRAYAGAYLAQLGGVDVVSFTAGVGENVPRIRADVLTTLGFAGIAVDPVRNAAPERGVRRISADSSTAEVLVVPTDEEREIARQALQLVTG